MTESALLSEAEAYLSARGVEEARANAEFLLASVLKTGRLSAQFLKVSPSRRQKFLDLVERRGRRIPLAYVLGSQNFMGMELRVTPDVLVPRPETEEVVEAAAHIAEKISRKRMIRILDVGTGSGCIALSLARLIPQADIYSIDVSPVAIAVAAHNAVRHGLDKRVRLIQADLFHLPSFSEKFDLLISNPPYIPSRRISSLGPEVLNEPRLALDGGPDGLKSVRAIIRQGPTYLRPGGWLVLEMDKDQGPKVLRLMAESGFVKCEVHRDLQGLARIASAQAGTPSRTSARTAVPDAVPGAARRSKML